MFLTDEFIGKTIGLKINDENIKLLNRVFDKLTIDSENYNKQEAVIMVFDHIDKKKPLEVITEVYKKFDEDIVLIKNLQTEIEQQEKVISDLKATIAQISDENTAYETELIALKNVNQSLSEIPQNELRIKLNSFYSYIIDKMIENKEVVKGIELNTDKTALVTISTPDKNQNRINYILNCVVAIACGQILWGKMGIQSVQNLYLQYKQKLQK